jgi:hypothetical protein
MNLTLTPSAIHPPINTHPGCIQAFTYPAGGLARHPLIHIIYYIIYYIILAAAIRQLHP